MSLDGLIQDAFDGMPQPPPQPEPAPQDSATVRRTKRQAALLASRRHPLSSPMGVTIWLHAEAAPADDRDAPGRRCGDCRFRHVVRYHNRSYAKCVLPGPVSGEPLRVSHSEATDVRAWWPACTGHEWGDPALSPDAARSGPAPAEVSA